MGTIGVFASSKHIDSLMQSLQKDSDNSTMYKHSNVIYTNNNKYFFYILETKEDAYKCTGIIFNSVQLHWSVNFDAVPYILSRCRK